MYLDDEIKDNLISVLIDQEAILNDEKLEISCLCKAAIFVNQPKIFNYELTVQFLFTNEDRYIAKEDLIFSTEERVMALIHSTDSSICHRYMNPVRELGLLTLSYKISFKDIDDFSIKLKKYAKYKLDTDFTKILESKIVQD